MKNKYICLLTISVFFLVFIGVKARADIYTFDEYDWEWKYIGGSSGYAPNTNIMDQLSVAVTDEDFGTWEVGDNQVLFIFSKTGTADFSLTDIHFDDGELFGIHNIFNSVPDVIFSDIGVTPKKLPAANDATPPFVTSSGLSTDVAKPAEGVDEDGESVGIVCDLKPGVNFDDIIKALYAGFDLRAGDDPTGTLRIGIHVSSIEDNAGNYSQSFILVPLPAAAILGLLGLSVAGIKLRKYA